jgi:hypothetical protein
MLGEELKKILSECNDRNRQYLLFNKNIVAAFVSITAHRSSTVKKNYFQII